MRVWPPGVQSTEITAPWQLIARSRKRGFIDSRGESLIDISSQLGSSTGLEEGDRAIGRGHSQDQDLRINFKDSASWNVDQRDDDPVLHLRLRVLAGCLNYGPTLTDSRSEVNSNMIGRALVMTNQID